MEILFYLQVLSLIKPFWFFKNTTLIHIQNIWIEKKKMHYHSLIIQTKHLFNFCSLFKICVAFFPLKGNLQFCIFLLKNTTYSIQFSLCSLPYLNHVQCGLALRLFPGRLPLAVSWDSFLASLDLSATFSGCPAILSLMY